MEMLMRPVGIIPNPASGKDIRRLVGLGSALMGLRPVPENMFIDLRTLSPLDHETLAQSVKKTHKAIVIQEAVEMAGVASQVVKSLVDSVFEYLDAPIRTVEAGNIIIPFSPPLEDAMLPNEEKIVAAAKQIVQ